MSKKMYKAVVVANVVVPVDVTSECKDVNEAVSKANKKAFDTLKAISTGTKANVVFTTIAEVEEKPHQPFLTKENSLCLDDNLIDEVNETFEKFGNEFIHNVETYFGDKMPMVDGKYSLSGIADYLCKNAKFEELRMLCKFTKGK